MTDRVMAMTAEAVDAVAQQLRTVSLPSNSTVALYAVASVAALTVRAGVTTLPIVDLSPDVALGLNCALGILDQNESVLSKLLTLLIWELFRIWRWYNQHTSRIAMTVAKDIHPIVKILCMVLAFAIILSAVWANTYLQQRARLHEQEMEPQPVADRVIVDDYPYSVVAQDITDTERQRTAEVTIGEGSRSSALVMGPSIEMDVGPVHVHLDDTPVGGIRAMPSPRPGRPGQYPLLLLFTHDWSDIQAV